MALLTRRYADPVISRIAAISREAENFRTEPNQYGQQVVRQNYVEPVPVGTIVVRMFRVVGYSRDCDGSALAELRNIDSSGRETGWTSRHLGLSPDTSWIADSPQDLDQLSAPGSPQARP